MLIYKEIYDASDNFIDKLVSYQKIEFHKRMFGFIGSSQRNLFSGKPF